MQQLTKTKAVLFHLYPGLVIAATYFLFAPVLIRYQLPPQFSLLIAVALVAIPLFLLHLNRAKKEEQKNKLSELNAYNRRLSAGKLSIYIIGLVCFMFLIWGITQPLNTIITKKFFSWLPAWYTTQDFAGYDNQIIIVTLVVNLIINGIVAPVAEEYYFRGYLLPRMGAWGKGAFVVNAILFSLYHFWQPYVYLTLLIALLPLSWAVWKTRDLRVGIYTHCALNVIGALASFGLLMR